MIPSKSIKASNHAPVAPTPRLQRGQLRRLPVLRAGEDDKKDNAELKDKFFGSQPDIKQKSKQSPDSGSNIIDNVNPYMLGRKTRQVFDDIWDQVSSLTSPTKSYVFDDVLDATMDMDTAPNASTTTVLVVGATGRVGRIVVRKLLLRGYKVRALIRKRDGIREDAEGVPTAVEVMFGDVGEMKDCQKAVQGVDKIVYCAGARTSFTADLVRVEDRGVTNIAKALQDDYFRRARSRGLSHSPWAKKEIADFARRYHQLRWDVDFVGVQSDDGKLGRDVARANLATAEITEDNNLLFEGALFSRGAVAEVGADLNPKLPGGEQRISNTEGLTLRVKAEGHTYACVLKTTEGHRYIARFPTRLKWSTVRLPFALFRPETAGQPPLAPETISHISLRYELKRPTTPAAASATAAAAGAAAGGLGRPRLAPAAQAALNAAEQMKKLQKYRLEVDWIKALPGGQEPSFILLSCAGAPRPGFSPDDLTRVLSAKRKGEEQLRSSGLGYTVIRPGPFVDEPGGYKALVFDQGDRVTQSVSFADVADICLRALHEPEARNKTFDVCYEYQPDEGLQMYELVASIPGKGGNYLAPALSSLQRNT